jgi:hypothetical protein
VTAGSPTFLPFKQIVAFDPNYRWPYLIPLNFGFQQEFKNGFAVSAYYVGPLNRKTPLYNDINGPNSTSPPSARAVQAART